MGLTDRMSCRGIIDDSAFVKCQIFMFLGMVTGNFDVLTTIMKRVNLAGFPLYTSLLVGGSCLFCVVTTPP